MTRGFQGPDTDNGPDPGFRVRITIQNGDFYILV